RGQIPGTAFATSESRDCHADVAVIDLRPARGRSEGGDGTLLRGEGEYLLGQPDSQLCISALPDGERSAHWRGDEQCAVCHGRRPGSVRQWLAPCRLPDKTDAGS